MLLTYFIGDFEMVPVAPIITGITFVFTFHMRYIIIIIIIIIITIILYIKLFVCTLYKFTFLNQSEPNFAHISPLVWKRP
jgi:hypothetical protein